MTFAPPPPPATGGGVRALGVLVLAAVLAMPVLTTWRPRQSAGPTALLNGYFRKAKHRPYTDDAATPALTAA